MDTIIGFIGFGKMAEALWKGCIKSGTLTPDQTLFTEHSQNRAADITTTHGLKHVDLHTLVSDSDIIIVCIKPQHIASLMDTWPKDVTKNNTLVVSILAGTPIATLESFTGASTPCVRVMPNTPALVGEGMSAFCCNSHVTAEQKSHLETLLNGVGKVIEVQHEADINTVTGISGSGPAFYYRLAQQSIAVGQAHGLTEQQSLILTAQTMIGAGKMLLESGDSPEELIQAVSSPNGTTVAGLTAFDNSSIDEDIKGVIEAAIYRANDLSKGEN